MGTAATPTKISGPGLRPSIGEECEFTLLLDHCHATGYQTVDLTDYFSSIHSCEIVGSLVSTGYFADVQKVAFDTAHDATNLKIFFYEAGADADVLDLMNATDLSAVITGLTITVTGKPVIDTSWA